MAAPEHAVPLREENPEWGGAEERVECSCGFTGPMDALLCVDESIALWCPQCRGAGWSFV